MFGAGIIKNLKITFRNDKYLGIGISFFILMSFGELLLVYWVTSTIEGEYITLSLVWLSILILNWGLMRENLQSEYLSKRYKFWYSLFVLFFILGVYFVLLYPTSPSLNTQVERFTSILPIIIGSMSLISLTNSFVYKDIDVHEKTGKSYWQFRDKHIKKSEWRVLLLILSFFPVILFVGFPLGAFLYQLSNTFEMDENLRYIIILFPIIGIVIFYTIIAIVYNKTIKQHREDLIISEEKKT
ncbi:MAG: hypothetical protein HeimC3_16470 [Candidatus Heimdallarchaeota archaeon LC_3]|nr:MAG: hypothetical protein HeimC3_16470 [Candidatus Heimdallarchaeota archaeon LC_3]